jgi:hypothetical protein
MGDSLSAQPPPKFTVLTFAFLNRQLYVQNQGYTGEVDYATQRSSRAISVGQRRPHRFPFSLIQFIGSDVMMLHTRPNFPG